jgi:peptidylprolyl isomerase
MKHSWKVGVWTLLLLSLSLMLFACGPAASPEADEATTDETTELEVTQAATEENEASAAAEPADTPESVVVEPVIGELEYIEVEAGEGPAPEVGDRVSVHYTGMLDDGTVFDSSLERGTPFEFVLGQGAVIAGWDQGIAMMHEGGKATLIIPPNLAYGPQGSGSTIPPNATLTFEVELVAVIKPPTPAEVAEADYISLDSGIQYYDIEAGDGQAVAEGDRIVVHFKAWIQGGEFLVDSEEQGPPAIYTLGSEEIFLNDWDEAVIGMNVGSQRQIIVPPEAASEATPPGQTLLLELSLLETVELMALTEVDEADLITTESGLQYYDIVTGDGAEAEVGQTVTIHYTGWLQEDVEAHFDSSLDRGEPVVFPVGVGQVLPGWDEGIVGMQVGGKRQLVLPPELGFGEAGRGRIGPDTVLLFEIELLEVDTPSQ